MITFWFHGKIKNLQNKLRKYKFDPNMGGGSRSNFTFPLVGFPLITQKR